MHAAEQVLSVSDVALDEGNVVLTGQVVDVAHDAEFAETGRHLGVRLADNVLVVAAAVVLKVLDGDDRKTPFLGLFEQLGGAHHRAVVAHDLAAQAALFQSCQTAQIDRCLGVAVAGEHAAAPRNQREHMTRTAQVLGTGVRVHAAAAGKAALLGGNAGRGVHVVDGNRKGGVVVVGVDLDHLLKAQTACDLLAHRGADESLGLCRHEVDVCGRGELRRADEVALVFAVGVVDDHDKAARAKLFKRLFNRAVFCCHVYSSGNNLLW